MAERRVTDTRPGDRRVGNATPAVLERAVRVTPKWRTHLRRLTALRAHLLGLQRDLARDAIEERPAFSKHMADAGTDSYNRDMALGLLSHEQNALYEIEHALDRIRNGTYGICEQTGKRIPAARLAAVPWTRFTAAAEKSIENKGGLRVARLGSPHTKRDRRPARRMEEKS